MRRYNNIPTYKTNVGRQVYTSVRYPEIPRSFEDTYVYTTIGDRYDTLAQQYYEDSSLWWIISTANSELDQSSLTPPIGSQIRIPSDPSSVIAEFNELNSNNNISSNNGENITDTGNSTSGGTSTGGGGY
jgi:hypothetical protein